MIDTILAGYYIKMEHLTADGQDVFTSSIRADDKDELRAMLSNIDDLNKYKDSFDEADRWGLQVPDPSSEGNACYISVVKIYYQPETIQRIEIDLSEI